MIGIFDSVCARQSHTELRVHHVRVVSVQTLFELCFNLLGSEYRIQEDQNKLPSQTRPLCISFIISRARKHKQTNALTVTASGFIPFKPNRDGKTAASDLATTSAYELARFEIN